MPLETRLFRASLASWFNLGCAVRGTVAADAKKERCPPMSAPAHNTAAEHQGFSIHAPPEDGAEAWGDVAEEVDALAHGETARVNLDLQSFADRAAGVLAGLRADDELYARFKRAAVAGLFEFAVIDRLARRLPALWYVAHMQQEEETAASRAVPEATLDAATERRKRMLKVAKHYLEEDADEGPRLAAIKLANDHARLANDLVTLAGVYRRHHDVVKGDHFFRADDEAKALADSRAIRAGLGGVPGGLTWKDRAAALFTLVQRDYQELRVTGTWLLRAKPEEARTRFPPTIERPGQRRSNAEDATRDDNDTGPANDAPVAPQNDTRPAAEPVAPAAPIAPAASTDPKPAAPAATKPRAASKPAVSAKKKPARKTR